MVQTRVRCNNLTTLICKNSHDICFLPSFIITDGNGGLHPSHLIVAINSCRRNGMSLPDVIQYVRNRYGELAGIRIPVDLKVVPFQDMSQYRHGEVIIFTDKSSFGNRQLVKK